MPVSALGVQLARRWDVLPESYRAAGAFHWGIHPGDDNSLAFARALTDGGARVCLEPFKPPDAPLSDATIREMLAACTVFSPNWLEAVQIAQTEDEPALLDRFRTWGCQILALRRGPDGADVWNLAEGRGVHVPAVDTTVVDVVGAGNTFCGALIARLDDGIASAACHASAAASYMIKQVGIPSALPDPADYARRFEEARVGSRELLR
jgi:ribokinase